MAVAGDVTEAEELQEILRSAGIDSELVPESSLEAAKDAIEAMTEPDDLIADA